MIKRPPTITVPAILLLIFEVFALFGIISNLAMTLAPQAAGSPFATSAALLQQSPEYMLYTKIAMPIIAVLAIVGIAAALGLFRGREWSRKAGIFLAVTKLLTTSFGTWMTIKYVHPLMEQMTASMATKGTNPAVMQPAMKFAMMAGAIVGSVFWLAVTVTIIILLTRKSAVAFCRGYVPGQPPAFD